MKKFVSDEFAVSEGFSTDRFKVRMLKIGDVVKDYDAVMTSVECLTGIFGHNTKWP